MINEITVPLPDTANGKYYWVEYMYSSGDLRRRLRDLGLIEGTRIIKLFSAPFGDPCAYYFRGTVTALRRADASGILVIPEPE